MIENGYQCEQTNIVSADNKNNETKNNDDKTNHLALKVKELQ